MPDDGFTLVTRRRRTRGIAVPVSLETINPLQGEDDIQVDKEQVLLKIKDARNIVAESEFSVNVESVLQQALNFASADAIREIICYGLGHFTECSIARYQLALLLILKDTYKATVYIHDPIFYKCEIQLLKHLGLLPIVENEEGKRRVEAGVTTLLYFPHCSKQLTNNFLWKNWGKGLQDCLLFGNSFSSILDRQLASDLGRINFIEKLNPYVKELEIENNFLFTDIFNNTSIHVFPEDRLHVLEADFWTEDCEEPVYHSNDTEFITKHKDESPCTIADSETVGIRDSNDKFS